jgi:hypothetical protein
LAPELSTVQPIRLLIGAVLGTKGIFFNFVIKTEVTPMGTESGRTKGAPLY